VFLLRSWDIIRVRRRNIHSALDTNQTSQEEQVFNQVHSEQEEGWQPDKAAIATQTNPFFTQQEYNSITSPDNRINATV